MVVLFLAILGIYLWIPPRWTRPHLRAVVLPRLGATGRARAFNLHNVFGIWGIVPILVIVWTGMAMSYNWAGQLTYWTVGTPNIVKDRGKLAATASLPIEETKPTALRFSGLDTLLSRAKRQSAGWKAITLYLPQHDSTPVDFAIDMSGYGGIGTIAGLELNQMGQLVSFTPTGAGGITAATFIRYGHTGEAWGTAGQTLAGAASLSGAILVWTGFALSFRRFNSWRRRIRDDGRRFRPRSQ
jgi:uncharacterized iron-regulated membrane protein